MYQSAWFISTRLSIHGSALTNIVGIISFLFRHPDETETSLHLCIDTMEKWEGRKKTENGRKQK